MSLLEEHQIDCPNCGETVEIVLDRSIIQQQYTEDCFVCCALCQESFYYGRQ